MTYRQTVVGVISQGKEFLVVQKPHWKGYWDFPQGGVEKGESLEQALRRELGEELNTQKFGEVIFTGITYKQPFSFETLKHYPNKGFIGKELFYFFVSYLGNKEDIKLGDDLCDKKWCREEELFKFTYQESREHLPGILEFMKLNKLI